jgi:hypothetical protein
MVGLLYERFDIRFAIEIHHYSNVFVSTNLMFFYEIIKNNHEKS